MVTRSFPSDVEVLSWAAEQLGIGESTAYRIAPLGQIPGAFKVGAQWRVSVPKFMRQVHGVDWDESTPTSLATPIRLNQAPDER